MVFWWEGQEKPGDQIPVINEIKGVSIAVQATKANSRYNLCSCGTRC